MFVQLLSLLVLFVAHAASEADRQQQSRWSFLNHSIFQLDTKFPPISIPDIIRGLSPHGYRGDVRKMHTVLKKALQKKYLNVIVLGGSVPLGAGLEPNMFRDCWPTKLREMLHKMFDIKVTVNNLSIRAVSSDSQASSRFQYIMKHVSAKNVDLILVDIGLNDKPHTDPEFQETVAYFEDADRISTAAKEASLLKERKKQGEGRLLMQLLLRFAPTTTAIMYFETFAGGGKTAPIIHSLEDFVAARRDGLTDGVYDFEEKAIVFDCFPDIGRYYHFQALVEYKIPIFSYPDVVCPIHNNSYWGNDMHHSKEYHHFTAYLLALAIFELAKSDISITKFDSELPFPVKKIKNWNNYIYDPSTDSKLRLDSKLVVCAITPLSYMAVNRPARFTPVRKGGAWRFYQDVANKPGWIADARTDDASPSSHGDRSRDIVFPITLSTEQPMLRLSFLRSYNKTMGTLSCCITSSTTNIMCAPDANTYIFDGHWSDQTSQGVAVAVHLNNIPVSSSPTRLSKPSATAGVSKSKSNPATNNDPEPEPDVVKRNIVCTADKGKFKIIGVVGC